MSPPRLSEATLDALPADVRRPLYDRRALKTGVVHLGPGAFHRAHQAVLFDDLAARGDLRWGVTGASLRSRAAAEAPAPQNGLYTLETREGSTVSRRVIGVAREAIAAAQDPDALIAALAGPDTHLVTLTITEAGYEPAPHDGADRGPVAAEILARGLAARRARGLAPFTTISCDNVTANGARLEALVLAAAARLEDGLADWIARNGAFPCAMSDRIVPATTEADIAALARHTGMIDRAMVRTEPFSQWVIEERFAGPRPDFAAVGVQIVPSVAPWEEAKLRLLNGAHSAMASLGLLAGLTYVHEFVADKERARFIDTLWDEAADTLAPSPGLDLAAYRRALRVRFGNAALAHRLDQIAKDASRKLPQRLIAPLAERRAAGKASPALALAVAGWVKTRAGPGGDPLARVDALLGLGEMFPPALAQDPVARSELARQLGGLDRAGALASLAAVVSGRA